MQKPEYLIETEGLTVLQETFANVPTMSTGSINRGRKLGPYLIDALVHTRHAGEQWIFAIEIKANGAPRFTRSAIYHLLSFCAHRQKELDDSSQRAKVIPLLICPYLSDQSQLICREHSVCFLDLQGNAFIAFGDVYIKQSVSEKPKSEARSLRSIFTPKAAAILRAMLREHDRHWKVTDLANAANASLGHVSNVQKALFDREWLEKNSDGTVLTQPALLVSMWRENYRRPQSTRISGYSHLHGPQLDNRLKNLASLGQKRPIAIYSLNSAAKWIAPFGLDGTQSFYTTEENVSTLIENLNFRRVGKGSNVVIDLIKDESLFDDAVEPTPQLFCTDPIVTYLDLSSGNDREREMANFLAQEVFPWLK